MASFLVLLVIVEAAGPARQPSSPAGGQGHLCLLAGWFIGHTHCRVRLWERQIPAWPPLSSSLATGDMVPSSDLGEVHRPECRPPEAPTVPS